MKSGVRAGWCAVAVLVGLAVSGAGGAQAQGAADVAAFRAAVALIAQQDWPGAEAEVAQAAAVTRDLVRWLRLRAGKDGGAGFADYAAFLAARGDWPGLDRLRARGEEVMPADLLAGPVLDWFAGIAPQTGQGAVRLAAALQASARPEAAAAVLVEAWVTLGLTDQGQAAMVAAYADVLAPHHRERADAMLWRWRSSDAARMLPLLSADRRLLAEARIAMIRGDGDRARRVAAVPTALRDDPGLAYDRFNLLADQGDYTDAAAILLARTDTSDALGEPFRWASWRATLARWAMREGRPRDAYRMATRHHLTTGDLFADLEWVAGYVALRYLDDPATALTHFQRMERAVSGPISVARAAYWTARAHEAGGDPDAAALSYARAAQHQTAFYGLLAAERLGLSLDPALAGTEAFGDWRQGQVLHQDLTTAMLLLIAADLRTEAILFTLRQARTLNRAQLGELGTMLSDIGEPFFALTLAKEAVGRDILIPALLFPLHPLAQMDLPVAPELALSVARRESEFNTGAGSPAGALGLMQLMPATAEEVAAELGLPYQRARLTTDWAYNVALGARYLANLEAMFGPSPVMVAAGYNAGASRPRTWMTQRGDPRRGEADVIDWIEHIPFAETRTYVMRVTEGIPIYRSRLAGQIGQTGQTGQIGQIGPLRFTDLLTGAPPRIRPLARPVPGQAAPGVVPTAAFAVAPTVAPTVAVNEPAAALTGPASALAPLTALRPPARPGG